MHAIVPKESEGNGLFRRGAVSIDASRFDPSHLDCTSNSIRFVSIQARLGRPIANCSCIIFAFEVHFSPRITGALVINSASGDQIHKGIFMATASDERPKWQGRVIRYGDLIPSTHAFIDTRTPGSDQKENFCLIGPGVAEDPGQHVHIRIPHGFNVGGARQPRGCKNSHHSHDTAEVFVVHRGQWKFTWGVDGSDGEVVLGAGETISIPTRVFRGFENVGDDDGFLFAVLGGDDPGHVTWAPYVFEDAKDYGLVLLEDGRLIDTAAGQLIPEDGRRQAAPTSEEVASFSRLSFAQMRQCVVTAEDWPGLHSGGLSRCEGVQEWAVLGPENPREDMPTGRLDWEHGFHVRQISIDAGASVPLHVREEEEVVFVQSGSVEILCDSAPIALEEGDLVTAPIGEPRGFTNHGNRRCELIVVRGGNHPAAAQWV